jgi:hypothetical protein
VELHVSLPEPSSTPFAISSLKSQLTPFNPHILWSHPITRQPVRLTYQPPASSTFLSEQISHQQPANITFLSAQISTSHQPPAKRTG